jgi:hypothetical protein
VKFTEEEVDVLIWTFLFVFLVSLYVASFIHEDTLDHKYPPPHTVEKTT